MFQKSPKCKDENSDAHVYLYSLFILRWFADKQNYKLLVWNVLTKFKWVYFILAFLKFEIIYFGNYFHGFFLFMLPIFVISV